MTTEEHVAALWRELAGVVLRQGETLVLLRELAERVAAIERESCATSSDATSGA